MSNRRKTSLKKEMYQIIINGATRGLSLRQIEHIAGPVNYATIRNVLTELTDANVLVSEKEPGFKKRRIYKNGPVSIHKYWLETVPTPFGRPLKNPDFKEPIAPKPKEAIKITEIYEIDGSRYALVNNKLIEVL